MLRRDLRHWIPACKIEGILVACLLFLFFVMQNHEILLYLKNFPDTTISLGDSLCAWLCGIPLLRFGDVNQMQLPVRWILLFMGSAVFFLRYPHYDYTHYRMQIFLRADNRQVWWNAKLICASVLAIMYYLLFITGCILLSFRYVSFGNILVTHAELWGQSLRISGTISAVLEMIIIPGAAVVAFSIITMTLSVFLNASAAVVVDLGILLAGCFFGTPLFFPAAVMYVRNDYFVDGSFGQGITASLAAAVSICICYFVGRKTIRRAEC
jgi:hypothetical protein